MDKGNNYWTAHTTTLTAAAAAFITSTTITGTKPMMTIANSFVILIFNRHSHPPDQEGAKAIEKKSRKTLKKMRLIIYIDEETNEKLVRNEE